MSARQNFPVVRLCDGRVSKVRQVGSSSCNYSMTFRQYEPTIFENYVAEIRLDGKAVQLALWDTAYVFLATSRSDRETDTLIQRSRRIRGQLFAISSCCAD